MFFNAQNPVFPFQFPNPFQMGANNTQSGAQGEEGQAAQPQFNPFTFFQQQMSQIPFPFCMGAKKTEGEGSTAEGEEAQASAQQQFNPFECFKQMFQMQQFMDMFKNMFPMFNMNPQNCSCQQGFNPFGFCMMPNMNEQMQQFMDMFRNMFPMFSMNPQNCSCQQGFNPFGFCTMPNMNEQMQQFMDMLKNLFSMFSMNPQSCGQQGFNPFGFCGMPNMNEQMQQFTDMLKNLFSSFGKMGGNQENGLPFGMPAKLLQFLLHMDSTPEGLSKFQKILDLIFDEYSKARAPKEE